jgi:hypothetical protein
MKRNNETVIIYRDGKIWKIFKSWWKASQFSSKNNLKDENDRYNFCEVTGITRFFIMLFYSYTE